MNDPEKVKALVRVGKLLGRSELEQLFKDAYAACKSGKTLTTSTATNKSFNFTLLAGMGPGEIFTLVNEALSTFDKLTALGRLDLYLEPVRSTGETAFLGPCLPLCTEEAA